MSSGLKKGLGNVIDLKVSLHSGKEGGNEEVAKVQKWMACGSDVTPAEDPHYYFYRVGACAFKSGSTVSGCIKKNKVPADVVERIENCTSDSARAKKLVSAMNSRATSIHSYPTIKVAGKSASSSPGSVISKICQLAKSRKEAVVPEACGGPPPGPPPPKRFHCNSATHECVELNEGHSTLALCQSVCKAPFHAH